jgi:hypothetical protein
MLVIARLTYATTTESALAMTHVAAVFLRWFCVEYRRSHSSSSGAPESKVERSWTLGSSGSGLRRSAKPAELPRPPQRRCETLVHRRGRVERLGEDSVDAAIRCGSTG